MNKEHQPSAPASAAPSSVRTNVGEFDKLVAATENDPGMAEARQWVKDEFYPPAPAPAPQAGESVAPGYSQRVIEALHENGDPVSIDAADEIERLLALLAAATPSPAVSAEPPSEDLINRLLEVLGTRLHDMECPQAFLHEIAIAGQQFIERHSRTGEALDASAAVSAEPVAAFRALLRAEIDASIDSSGDIARQEAQIDEADHLLVKFNELFPEAS